MGIRRIYRNRQKLFPMEVSSRPGKPLAIFYQQVRTPLCFACLRNKSNELQRQMATWLRPCCCTTARRRAMRLASHHAAMALRATASLPRTGINSITLRRIRPSRTYQPAVKPLASPQACLKRRRLSRSLQMGWLLTKSAGPVGGGSGGRFTWVSRQSLLA